MEDEPEIKHRLEEKAEGMFDPHKLKGNILKEGINDVKKEQAGFSSFGMEEPEKFNEQEDENAIEDEENKYNEESKK